MKNTSPKKVTANHHASIANESGATDCSNCLLSLKRSLHIFQLQHGKLQMVNFDVNTTGF